MFLYKRLVVSYCQVMYTNCQVIQKEVHTIWNLLVSSKVLSPKVRENFRATPQGDSESDQSLMGVNMQDIQRVIRESHLAGNRAFNGNQSQDVANTVGSFDHWKNHISGNPLVIKVEHLFENQVGYFAEEDFTYDWNYESTVGDKFPSDLFQTVTKHIGNSDHLYEQYLYGLNFIQVIRIYGFTAFLTNNTTTLY